MTTDRPVTFAGPLTVLRRALSPTIPAEVPVASPDRSHHDPGVPMTESATTESDRRAVSATDADHSLAVLTRHAMSVHAAAHAPTSVTLANGPVSLRITWDRESSTAGAGAGAQAPIDSSAPGIGSALLESATSGSARPEPETGEKAVKTTTFTLAAETVGVFYHAPEPGAAPFVAVGDPVRAGQQIGIIEAMKLMIPVAATREGVLAELLVDNGDAVEHGQPLMVFEELR